MVERAITIPMVTTGHVSINPSTFVDYCLVDKPMEDVVAMFKDEERKRSDKWDFPENAASITYRSTIRGLEMSIDRICGRDGLNMGNLIFQRCLSHQIEKWFGSIPEISSIIDMYDSLLVLSDDKGFDDIGSSIRDVKSFKLKNEVKPETPSGKSSFATVGMFKAAMLQRAKKVGIEMHLLMSIGLGWSISTNRSGWSEGSISMYFQQEVDHLKQHLRERLLYLEYCQRVADSRLRGKDTVP